MTGALDASHAADLARTLEREIRDGALAPGHRIGTKEELRTRFRVAVGTVSAAVRSLELRGVVEARPGPGGGLFVASSRAAAPLARLTRELHDDGAELADCLAVLGSLDGLVAAEAAQHATAEDRAALREIAAAGAGDADDPRAVAGRGWLLQRRLAELSPNPLLRGLYGELLDVAERAAAGVGPDAGAAAGDGAGASADVAATVALQREVVEAVAARDAARAAAQLTLLGSRRISQTCGPPSGMSSSVVVTKPSRS